MIKNKNELEHFFNKRKQLGIKPGLERINKLFELLDNPQERIKAIHVAGTNGKGSTINFIKQALIENNYDVGVFTSPSLTGLTGHIEHNNENISENEFLKLFNVMHPAIQQLDNEDNHPTEFEIITVLAFLYFSDHVDIALIETGMGGRDDTTNCFTPILSIITNVDLDHTSFLGNSIAEVTSHKAGIIKQKIPVIVGETKTEALTIIRQKANELHAPIYELNKDFTYKNIEQINDNQVYDWNNFSQTLRHVQITMFGEHQVKNSSLAIMALSVIEKKGIKIEWNKVLDGLANTMIQGRFEKIQENPTIILDGAHNPAGIQSFLETLTKTNTNKEKHLLFAAFKDKNIDHMLELLLPHFTTITLTTFDHSRATKMEQLYTIAKKEPNVSVGDWQETLKKMNNKRHHEYYVTGSLHFIGIVRSFVMTNNRHEK